MLLLNHAARLAQTTHAAYVTSGLPGKKHRAWLRRMTDDICDSPPGDLSPELLSAAPQIMDVWARNPYVPDHQAATSSPKGHPKKGRVPPAPERPKRTTIAREGSSQQRATSAGFGDDPGHGLECALAVEGLLKRLVDERSAGNEGAAVTTVDYNSVLRGWANSDRGGAAAQRAEQVIALESPRVIVRFSLSLWLIYSVLASNSFNIVAFDPLTVIHTVGASAIPCPPRSLDPHTDARPIRLGRRRRHPTRHGEL